MYDLLSWSLEETVLETLKFDVCNCLHLLLGGWG